MTGKHESRRKSKGTWTIIRRAKHPQGTNFLAKEVRWLQDKAWKARRRAGERKEHRNKPQNNLLKRISLLTTALWETAPLQPQDRIKGATKKAMQGLGSLHLRTTFQKLVRQHNRWKALLSFPHKMAEHQKMFAQGSIR